MTLLDGAWHLLNALAAPFGVALLSVFGMKLCWRGDLQDIGVMPLLLWAYLAAAAAYVGTWTYTGAEGSMLGYALTVLAVTLALWLRGFVFRT